mmetsp:Transcript_52589/g.132170  ORF Transcript_52589/g.132170 Transcript_52589/m.132170 type:complete len:167 (-) Transcript_52589:204-704(-)
MTTGDLFLFSLSGSFPQPTQIHPPQDRQRVQVAGRDGAVQATTYGPASAKIMMANGYLWLGNSRSSTPSPSILSCHHWIHKDITPPGFTGREVNALTSQTAKQLRGEYTLAGSGFFTADVIEVYQVVRGRAPAINRDSLLPLPVDFPRPLSPSALSSRERTCRTPA